jgi:GNAT superfamily N-acetyltransferase
MAEGDLVRAAHANFLASFRKLAQYAEAGEVRSFGPVFAVITGVPIAVLNGCVILGHATPADLDEALEWLRHARLPFRVFFASEPTTAVSSVLSAHALTRDGAPYPAMVLHPLPEPIAPSPGIELSDGLDSALGQYLPAALAHDADVRVFTARIDHRAAGMSLAIRSGDVAGVYGVVTRPEFRRRGVGTALSWAAVRAAREWGCASMVLQATPMGYPVYERMGFRPVARYVTFTGAPRPPFPE